MSSERCPNCHETVNARSVHCDACGLPVRGRACRPALTLEYIRRANSVRVAGLAIGAAQRW